MKSKNETFLERAVKCAHKGGTFNWEASINVGDGYDAERIRTFYTVLLKGSNEIEKSTNSIDGNYIVIASPCVVAMLQSMDFFIQIEEIKPYSVINLNEVGKLGRFIIYRDSFSFTSYAIITKDSSFSTETIEYKWEMFLNKKGLDNTQLFNSYNFLESEDYLKFKNFFRYVAVKIS